MLALVVGEPDAVELHFTTDGAQGYGPARVAVLRAFAQHFASALQPGERLCQLRPDADHLEHRRDQERQESRERDELAERECSRENLP